MTFDDILAQVLALLQREQRISYRTLKPRFALDDDSLEDVKDELIYAKKLARDEDNQAEAETCFHKALDIARSQQAKSFVKNRHQPGSTLATTRQTSGSP